MIGFVALTAVAVALKFIDTQFHLPLTVAVASAALVVRLVLGGAFRQRVDTFLLRFGVLVYALANRDPSSFGELALLLCVVPAAGRASMVGRLLIAETSCVLLVAYMVWSSVWSANASMTLAGLLMSIVCLVFAFGCVVTWQGDLRRVFKHLLFVLGALAAGSLVVGVLGYGFVGRTFAGVTSHRNQFGFLLGLGLLLGVFLLAEASRSRRVLAHVAALAGAAALFVYTDSKSALVALTAASLLWFISRSRWWFGWATLTLAAAALFFITLPSPKMDHFALRLGRDPTFTSRTLIWADSLKLLAEQPYTGFGYNATWHAFENRLSQYPDAPGPKYAHAHNALIEWGLHLGASGVFLYVVFLAVLTWRARQWARASGDTQASWWVVSVLTFVQIYNLANVSDMPINRVGFFVLSVMSASLCWQGLGRQGPTGSSREAASWGAGSPTRAQA